MSDPGTFDLSELSGTFNLTINGYPPGTATALADLTDVHVPGPSEGQVLVFDEGTDKWIAATGSALAAITVDLSFAVDAVDGTGDAFTLIRPNPAAAASGDIPAGWEPAVTQFAASDYTEASLAAVISGVYGGSATVFVPAMGAAFAVTATGSELTFTALAAAGLVLVNYPGSMTFVSSAVSVDAANITFTGTGLDSGFLNVKAALLNHEGTLDRKQHVSAISDTNVNLAAILAASWTYGGLDFSGGSSRCFVQLRNQTDPGENGFYEVAATGATTKVNHPDIFDPPGQGASVWLKAPGNPDDGCFFVWLIDDPGIRQRANGSTNPDETGRWVGPYRPGGGGGGDITTDTAWAAKGDLIVATGNNAASVLTVGANDTILIADSGQANGAKWAGGSTARTALGVGGIVAGQDEGTTVSATTTETTLLDSTPTVTAAAGEALRITMGGTCVQNSGGSASPTLRLKLDGSTVLAFSASLANSATVRPWEATATIRVQANGDANASGTCIMLAAVFDTDVGTHAGDLSAGQALDVTWQHPSATNCSAEIAYLLVERVRSA